MKFSEIPQLIESGNYEVNVGLKYLETIIGEYIDDYGLELNPDFQRGHVWTERQQIAYVEFFLKGGKTSNIIYFSCPYFGGIGSYEDYLNGKYDYPMVCVDGLQRLTALRKFLNNEIKVFGYYLNEFEDKDIILRRSSLRFNVNNLKTKKEVLQWYLEMNTGGTPHSQEEITRVKEMYDKLNSKF